MEENLEYLTGSISSLNSFQSLNLFRSQGHFHRLYSILIFKQVHTDTVYDSYNMRNMTRLRRAILRNQSVGPIHSKADPGTGRQRFRSFKFKSEDRSIDPSIHFTNGFTNGNRAELDWTWSRLSSITYWLPSIGNS